MLGHPGASRAECGLKCRGGRSSNKAGFRYLLLRRSRRHPDLLPVTAVEGPRLQGICFFGHAWSRLLWPGHGQGGAARKLPLPSSRFGSVPCPITEDVSSIGSRAHGTPHDEHAAIACLLYTSDAADDLLCVDLGGRRII